MRVLRVMFPVLFVLPVVAGAWLRATWPGGPGLGPSVAVVGVAALVLAAIVVLLEVRFCGLFAGQLSSVVYGALMGWAVGLAFAWTVRALPGARMTLGPTLEAALTLGFMYLGVVMAIRCTASGCTALRMKVRKNSRASVPGRASRAVWWVRIVFALFAAGCLVLLWVSSDRSVLLFMLIPAGIVLDMIFGKRLPGVLSVGLPAVFFAAAVASQTFALLSSSGWLNLYLPLEFQQAALFVLWLYVGVTFLLRAKQTDNYVVPLVAFEES